MSAQPESLPAWSGAPLTKFRAPRTRRDTVPRPELLARLAESVQANPVTLICAPGGSGKTTLLSQLAAGAGGAHATVWAAIDGDDNDANRLFATLVRAAEPLGLTWESDPRVLIANVSGSGPQSRAALAALVNALCTAAASRIVFVLDDFHRIDDRDALALIESLIERLPAHVALVIGTRVEPDLPLARWRVHGELGELTLADLRFSEGDAVALANARGGAPDAHALRAALNRTHGWAVGLTMALQARTPAPASNAGVRREGEGPDRHLFAYLAQEILAELPAELQEFVLRSSVLAELSPTLCGAVTGHEDTGAILDALYRRNLFLTALEDSAPVLRFHDLFREFLQAELARRHPDLVKPLHERAGRAETVNARAIAHFLTAECWNEAMALIRRSGESLLAEGGLATLERWIDQIPQAVRTHDPHIAYLRGVCAWLRWDWVRAKQEFAPAIAGFAGAEQASLRVRAQFDLVDALVSSGEAQAAWGLLEEISRQPLDEFHQAQLALHRAWFMLPAGNPPAVASHLNEFLIHVERDPTVICPRTAERIHCLCIGLPGVATAFERFFIACESVRGSSAAPWHMAALAVGAWAHLWHGRRAETRAAIERAESLLHQFGGIRLIAERILLFRAHYNAATGQHAAAVAQGEALLESLQAPEAAGHRAAWQRAYQHGLARLHLLAGNRRAFDALAPALLAPRRPSEWPFLDVAADLVRGEVALGKGDHETAQQALRRAIEGHGRFRMPMIYGDPRVALARSHLALTQRQAAWQAFEPVYREVQEQNAVGLLLLEPQVAVQELLDTAPDAVRRSAVMAQLRKALESWGSTAKSESTPAALPLQRLTDREREVLAQVASGAANKHIARALELSLHTVKRHIANILDKLDCASRGQAADLYRRHAG